MRTFLQGFKNLEDILSISIFKVTYLHISYLQGYLNASWHSHTPTALFYLNGITLGVPSVFCDQSHLPSRRTVSSGSRLGLSSEIPSLSWQLNPVLWPQHHRPCPVPWSLHGRVDVTQYSRLRIELCSCSSSSFSDTLLLNSGLISWVQTFPWSLTSGTFLCWDLLILFLAFLGTPPTPLRQYSWLLTAPLLVCALAVLPHQSHTSYNLIHFQQFKFISFLPLRFPISPHSSEFNYHFLREALPDVPNEVRCLLTWIRWDVDTPSTALPWHMAPWTKPWTKVYFQHNRVSAVRVRTTPITTHHPVNSTVTLYRRHFGNGFEMTKQLLLVLPLGMMIRT